MSLRSNSRVEVRRNRYKVAVDAEEGRRRREDNMVEIRKSKREESLQKKRREGALSFPVPVEPTNALDKKVQLENLPSMVASVWTDDASRQLEATTQFRKLLSIERSPPIQEVIQAGVVPRSGNVAGDSPRCRDLVLGHGALAPLLAQLNEHAKLSMLRNATWTLSKRPQSTTKTRPALPILQQLIHSSDEEVLTDACWALSYLSDGTNDKISVVNLLLFCFQFLVLPQACFCFLLLLLACREFSLNNMTGAYRRVFQKPKDFQWEVIKYTDVNIPLAETNWNIIAKSQPPIFARDSNENEQIKLQTDCRLEADEVENDIELSAATGGTEMIRINKSLESMLNQCDVFSESYIISTMSISQGVEEFNDENNDL